MRKPVRFLQALILLLTCLPATDMNAQDTSLSTSLGSSWNTIDRVDCGSVRRTNCEWLASYLGLYFPIEVREGDLRYFEQKLLTTGVFSSVKARIEATVLYFDLDEKWTTIPVIRGAYGGGTPLAVFGIYDTHSFGRLWTLGAETRKYGDAPLGYVVWASAPRWGTGKHVMSFEYWRSPRVRSIYDQDYQELGQIHTDDRMLRLLFMHPIMRGPLRANDDRIWQLGLDLKIRSEAPASFYPSAENQAGLAPLRIRLPSENSTEINIQPRIVYDDTQVDNVTFDGIRFIAQGGPLLTENFTRHRFDIEGFYYAKMPARFNLATHGYIGGATTPSLQNQYFLGGFDSIRGLPDGAMHGVRAAYGNFEIRHLAFQYRYAWVQLLAFADTGSAADSWSELVVNWTFTAGVGVRIAIPQVYRLMFRADYAWSLEDPNIRGFSAGLNQYFDPYRPL